MVEPNRTESPDVLFPQDPPWLAALRQDAWSRQKKLTYPLGREERWRYTDVAQLRDDRFQGALSVTGLPNQARASWSAAAEDTLAAAALVDGAVAELRLEQELTRQGVRLMSLDRAARQEPELLRAHLGKLVGPEDVFTARSLALHRGGLLLHVPAGVAVRGPVRWLHWLSAAGAAVDTRSVVILEAGASLHLEERFESNDLARPTRVQPVLELYVGPGAQLTYAGWQTWGAGVHHLGQVRARLDRDARLTSLTTGFGADYARMEHHARLEGEGAEATLLGAYFPTGTQKHEFWTVQDHRAPHTTSDLLYKGALGGAGRGLYYGTIRVSPDARRTDAYQANRNLILSPEARVDTNPQLEIETNDVRCTHGATVGQVDPAQRFYLMSRGIPQDEAERMLVAGFFTEVLSRLGDPDAEPKLTDLITRALSIP